MPRKQKPGMSQYAFVLPQNTHKKLKLLSMMTGRSQAKLLIQMIDSEFKKNEKNIKTWLNLAGISPESDPWIYTIER